MISFNIEMLNSGNNPTLQTSFIKSDAAIANFKNLRNMAVLEKCLNKRDMEKGGYKL